MTDFYAFMDGIGSLKSIVVFRMVNWLAKKNVVSIYIEIIDPSDSGTRHTQSM